MARKLIWTDQARSIVRDNWSVMDPPDLRQMVINYCKWRAKQEGSASYAIPSLGGVLYQALDMDLIDKATYHALKKEHKRQGISQSLRQSIIERDGHQCVVCKSADDLEVDHIKPVMMGGDDTEDNLQTLCKECHRIKGLNTIDCRELPEFMRVGVKPLSGDRTSVSLSLQGKYEGHDIALKLAWRHIDAILLEGQS